MLQKKHLSPVHMDKICIYANFAYVSKSVLEQTRHSFINEIRELVGSPNNEKLLGLILDPSTAGVHEENHDSHWETRIFSLTRGLCYALHVQRNTLLASI